MLRKAHSHSVVICRLKNPRRKTDSNFDFSQALPSAYEVLIRRMLCSENNRTYFIPEESEIVRYLNSDRIAEGSILP